MSEKPSFFADLKRRTDKVAAADAVVVLDSLRFKALVQKVIGENK